MIEERGLRAQVQRNFLRNTVEIRLFQQLAGERIGIVEQIQMRELQMGEMSVGDEQILQFAPESAQDLMDQLWNAGFRPTEIRDRNDVVNAKDQHIKDLQKVLTAFIEVTGAKGRG